jgi:transcriptional regulator with XRE-family HTH domain
MRRMNNVAQAASHATKPVRHVTPITARPEKEDVKFSPWAFIDALRDADMTPKELAAEMGSSVDAIARWMAGIASPKPGYATHAAIILGVNVGDLYETA